MELVPKGVPPDKSVDAWPSVQEKTTGTGNFGMSPRGGTNVDDQSLKVQVNLREPPVKPVPSFNFGGRIRDDTPVKPVPSFSFGGRTIPDDTPVKPVPSFSFGGRIPLAYLMILQ